MRFNEPFACSIDKQFSRFVRFQFSCKLAVLGRKISEVSTILFRPSTTQKTIIRLSMSKPINAPFMLKPKAVKTRQKKRSRLKGGWSCRRLAFFGDFAWNFISKVICARTWTWFSFKGASAVVCSRKTVFCSVKLKSRDEKKTASHHKAQCWSRGKPETSSIQRTYEVKRENDRR